MVFEFLVDKAEAGKREAVASTLSSSDATVHTCPDVPVDPRLRRLCFTSWFLPCLNEMVVDVGGDEVMNLPLTISHLHYFPN